jgi:hypothetical protein
MLQIVLQEKSGNLLVADNAARTSDVNESEDNIFANGFGSFQEKL